MAREVYQLKNVEALHKYLRRNNLAKFIPKSGQLLEDKPLRRKPVAEKYCSTEVYLILMFSFKVGYELPYF